MLLDGVVRESSLLMIFNTWWGKYRWLQLSLSLSVSSDVFQERLDAVIKTVPGVTGIADDVLAKGDNEISHDIAILSMLEMAQSSDLKFNPDKIEIMMKACRFLGKLLTPEGMSIVPKKVNAVR